MRKMQVSKVWVNPYEKGKLLGFADIKFKLSDNGQGCMTWTGVRLFKDDDGEIQLGLPTREAMKDGKKEYFPVIKMDKEDKDCQSLMSHITSEVVKAYEEKLSEGNSGGGTSGGGDDDIPF